MKKMLAFCLSVLLLVSCSKADDIWLTLIFENAPENSRALEKSDSIGLVEKYSVVKYLYWYTDDYAWGDYIPEGSNDTLSINCGKTNHLEIRHNYRWQASHYALLQAGDTVYVRYAEDGTPTYRSSISDELTTLYNGDILFLGRPPTDFKEALVYKLRLSYREEEFKRRDPARSKWYPPLDSMQLVYQQSLQKLSSGIDSLVSAGLMPTVYEQYYRYRQSLYGVQPEYYRLLYSDHSEPLSKEILAFLSDDFCRYMSYSAFVGYIKLPLISYGSDWQVTTKVIVDKPGCKVVRAEEGEVFDRLELFADRVPPKTLNLMRYECLMIMKNNPHLEFSQEYQQQYFEKYRRFTTDFLVPEYIPIQQTMSFPFRFFVFILEMLVCMGMFWGVYLSLIRDRVGFLASRIYLLAALVLSAVIPSLMLPMHIAMLPDSALYWDSMVGQLLYHLLYLYLAGCMFMLGYFAWQLYQLRRMWKNSWRIPGYGYTLCILTEKEMRPFAFLRNIFFSWSDWWDNGTEESRNHILAHEVAHVKAWHSLDNMLIALGRILYWANPLLLTYGKELRRVNEFSADRAVTRAYDKTAYASTIKTFGLGLGKMAGLLVNSNSRAYADRIGKLEAKAVPWYRNVKVLVIIPLAILLMLLFSSELLVNLGKLSSSVGMPSM